MWYRVTGGEDYHHRLHDRYHKILETHYGVRIVYIHAPPTHS